MKLPKQVKSTERGLAAGYAQNGVAANGWLDTLGSIAKTAAPIVGGLLSSVV